LALLADHLGDDREALARYEGFMREVVAHLDNAWRLTSADIDRALGRGLAGRRAQPPPRTAGHRR
jgi:hypothetical protein